MASVFSIIVAMTKNQVIGKNNDLPWGRAMKSDLRRFKKMTQGNIVIMGHNTYTSLPISSNGMKLPGRRKIVLTRSSIRMPHGDIADVAPCFEHALSLCEHEKGKVFIIGGSQVFSTALNDRRVKRMYVTYVDAPHLDGDVFFPDFTNGGWGMRYKKTVKSDEDKYHSDLVVYERA